ncbi:MAG: hypothetical protein CXT73_05105 [Methanobacteriota archaeon]|nr:MAG: hypothetical protein CXT73_05105 [Euryarchaeota archaeon]
MPKLFFLQNYKKLVVGVEKQIIPFNLLHIGGVFLNVQKNNYKKILRISFWTFLKCPKLKMSTDF